MAVNNAGQEAGMRAELAAAVGGLITNASAAEHVFAPAERTRLINLANIVTWARTGVERDYRGYVTDVHASEMPTRLSKQLAMLVRGAVAIGIPSAAAMQLATRCARDTPAAKNPTRPRRPSRFPPARRCPPHRPSAYNSP